MSTTPAISVSPPRSVQPTLRTRVSFTSSPISIGSPHPIHTDAAPARTPSPTDSTSPKIGRNRSSSLLSVHEIKDNYDDQLDQGVGPNLNANWVDFKGAWIIHVVMLAFGKVLVDILPGITQDVSWTIVNVSYNVITYIMFHYVAGTPFESSGGVYDRLTLWEQIDMGAHYTPSKKYYTVLPVVLFLLCTHYTRFALYPSLFALNFISTFCLSLLPKLPMFHRLRFRFLEGVVGSTGIGEERSGPSTPIEESMRRSVGRFDGMAEAQRRTRARQGSVVHGKGLAPPGTAF